MPAPFIASYKELYGATVNKSDIFYFVYALLHSLDYRKEFESDLNKLLARIPRVARFDEFVALGRMAELHIGYEDVEPYPLIENVNSAMDIAESELFRVQKMSFGRGKVRSQIVFNRHVTLSGIPIQAYEYSLGARSAIEWIMERYQVTEHDLLSFPARIGWMNASWTDDQRDQHSLDTLEDLAKPYSDGLTTSIILSRQRDDHSQMLTYASGDPRPRAHARFEGSPQEVENKVKAFDKVFPEPFEGQLVFVSWGGNMSRSVAEVLAPMLESRFGGVEVFFSETSIDPSEGPLHETFEEGLLRANVVVAVLTEDSVIRPWVVWEMATAWARDALLIPIFVNVRPGAISGPLTLKAQGVPFDDAKQLDRAFNAIARRIKQGRPTSVTPEEVGALVDAASA